MPVLPSEPSLYPTTLFADHEPLNHGAGRWWALHTRPRAEKTVARMLLQRGIPFFLPLHERARRIQRRVVRSHLPLFPGYLFMRGDDEARTAAFATRRIAGCLHVEEQERLARELAKVYDLICSGAPLAPEERLQPGMPAEITSGPLTGCRGKVVRCGKAMKFVIEVDFLQQGASVEVDSTMIRPA
jgi:transcription antitermination factor NusG